MNNAWYLWKGSGFVSILSSDLIKYVTSLGVRKKEVVYLAYGFKVTYLIGDDYE